MNHLCPPSPETETETETGVLVNQEHDHDDHHQPVATIITALPLELLVDVLGRVAAASFTDLFCAKLCCRDFLGAAEENYILEHVSIEKFPVIHQWLKRDDVSLFLNRCTESGNAEALYRQGMVDYFSSMRIESGLELLRRAAEKGHVEASYVYGIILLCRGGQSSIQGLKLLNALQLQIQECREKIKTIIHTMWVNNTCVVRQQQESLCYCHERRRRRSNNRVTETWNGTRTADEELELDDDSTCEACKWYREVNLFRSMLPRRTSTV